jgi:hypothetical protein
MVKLKRCFTCIRSILIIVMLVILISGLIRSYLDSREVNRLTKIKLRLEIELLETKIYKP